MANYNIDLLLTIKNSNKLKQLNQDFQKTNEEQKRVRKGLKEMDKGYKKFFPSLNKIVSLQSKAQEMFNKTALGTKASTMAAKDLVAAQRLLNYELQQRNKLLKEVRGGAFESNVVQNVGRSQRARASSGFAAFSSRASEVSESAKIEIIKEKARERHLKNIGNNVAKIATIQTQQQAQAAFSALPGGTFGMAGGQIGPRQPLRNRLGFGKNALEGPFAMPGGAMGRIKGGVGSALIGGGFPLLFGQGGVGAAAGALGGLLGGALSPGGGFAGSIIFTAVAQEIEKARQFRKEIGKLSKGAEMLGLNTNFSRKEIKALAKQFDLTLEESLERVREFKKFGGELAIGLAETFGTRETFNLLTGLINTETVIKSIVDLSEELGVNFQKDALNILALQGPLEANKFAIKETLGLSMKLKREAFGKEYKNLFEQYGVVDSPSYRKAQLFIGNPKMMEFLQKTKIPEIRAIMDNEESLKNNKLTETAKSQLEQIITPLIKDKEAFINALIDADSGFKDTAESALLLSDVVKDLNLRLKFVQEFNAPKDELTEMLNPLRRILDLSVNIRDGFEESFKGIIKGTMSVSDAFRSMLNRIADYFLDYAARMSALGLQNMFLSIFNKQFTFDDIFERPGVKEVLSEYRDKRANGGNVIGGKSYLVGERGPELFTPGATGTITANDAIGGANIVVNVDASGTSVEGNQTNGEELGRLIGAVVQSELIKEKRPGGLLA